MGNVIGSSNSNRVQLQSVDEERRRKDIQSLCERVSFGDNEISQFYDAYHTFQQSLLVTTQQNTTQQQLQQQHEYSSPVDDDPTSGSDRNFETTTSPSTVPTTTYTPSVSFFYDWYQAILNTSPQQQDLPISRKLQLEMLHNVILNILPQNFDIALYRTCFIVPEDASAQHRYTNNTSLPSSVPTSDTAIATTTVYQNTLATSASTKSTIDIKTASNSTYLLYNSQIQLIQPDPPQEQSSHIHMDEYTRTTRLYKFFDALSTCNGRRTSKDSISVLFDTVHSLQQQQPRRSDESIPMATPSNDVTDTTATMTATTTTAPNDIASQQEENRVVSARHFVETGYRIALALAYLEQQQELLLSVDSTNGIDDENNNIGQVPVAAVVPTCYTPTFQLTDEAEASLQAMAMSIVEKRKKRQRQLSFYSSRSSSLSTTGNDSLSMTTPNETTMTMAQNNNNSDDNDANDDTIELIDVLEWIEAVAPMFPYILPTFFNFLLFPNPTMNATTGTTNTTTKVLGRTTFSIPKIISIQDIRDKTTSRTSTTDTLLYPTSTSSQSSSSTSNDTTLLLSVRHFIAACYGTSLNGYYYPIYNSNIDGLSFNRLQNAIMGYGGPTLFMLQSVSGGIFGAYTGTSWKESKDFYGNTDSFLYQLQPQVVVYRPKSSGATGNYMYCNSAARSRGYDQQAHGIGFGGTVQQPRLFISENFDDGCMASSQDMTYDNGPLLPNVGTSDHSKQSTTRTIQSHRSLFDVECIEVYGVSDNIETIEMAIGSRTLNRANKEELIRKARKVDKAQFLDDFQSGIISSKAFVHRQQVDGRADADDCRLKQQQE